METTEIINNRGQKLSALVFNARGKAAYTIIVCHGFRGTKINAGKIFSFADRLVDLDFNVIAADFAGSGDSEGEFADVTLSGQGEDLRCIIDYAWLRYKLPLILLGRSFGGSTLLVGGTDTNRVAGYIFWSTPIMLKDTFSAIITKETETLGESAIITLSDAAGVFQLKPGFIRDFDKHNMETYLRMVGSRPVLIVHGKADELVNPANAIYIHNHLVNSKLFLVDDADHRFLNHIKYREDLTINWLKENFPKGG
ncbi:MAG: alpha/beta hydrolase [Syntrophomonadaceae bacterium]|jgi:pimeloyl-ACP methyl ester carboxylesterase